MFAKDSDPGFCRYLSKIADISFACDRIQDLSSRKATFLDHQALADSCQGTAGAMRRDWSGRVVSDQASQFSSSRHWLRYLSRSDVDVEPSDGGAAYHHLHCLETDLFDMARQSGHLWNNL